VSAARATHRIVVHGRTADGRTVVDEPLPHGRHPEQLLAERGWHTLDADRPASREPDLLVLGHLVEPLARATDLAVPQRVSRDDDLVLAAGERAVRVQRLAAYAIVVADAALLLTMLSVRTNAAGQWSLPGGGVDTGEAPEAALVREVHEETGQRVTVGDYLGCVDGHWVGRAPDGEAQDFHAVRLVYRAHCPEPSEPVVHDIGGTTSEARWVPLAGLAALPVTATWRELLGDLVSGWGPRGRPEGTADAHGGGAG